MGDEKLRQELFYMVRLVTKYDFSDMTTVEGVLRLENERKMLSSVFGSRFKTRIFDIAAGVNSSEDCVICGKTADNKIICKQCIDSILDSDYAKSQLKTKEDKKENFLTYLKNLNPKKIGQIAIIVCLTLVLLIQIIISILWFSLPDYNKVHTAIVSEKDAVSVNNQNDAYEQLCIDFPTELGYSVYYVRQDQEYVGRFLLEKGDCCEEIEATLTDEQRYDYFYQEPVYVFYIKKIDDYNGELGIAEVNSAGSIIICGSFNDNRRTDCFYKIR